MKASGYDAFFKKAKKNAAEGKKPAERKKQLSDYTEAELRKFFNMEAQPQVKKTSAAVTSGRRRMRAKNSSKNGGVSVAGIILAFTMLVASSTFFLFPEEVGQWISKLEFRFVGQASAADQEKTSTNDKTSTEQSSSDSKQVGAKSKVESEKEEVKDTSYFSKLNDRKKQLDLREQELEELERELNKQKVEIEARIQYLEKVRRDIAGVLKDRVEVDKEKIKKLVEFYSSMKPAQAAEIISTINEDLAIGVLSNMKKKNAAAILNMIEPKKARKLSEKFAGYIKE